MLVRSCALLLLAFLVACSNPPAQEAPSLADQNPPATGFDLAGSDSLAMAIADEVMAAMGGRSAWDSTRYVGWTFLSGRKLLWDKHQHRVRIEFPSQNLLLVTNLETGEGQAVKDGVPVTEPDSLAPLMDMAQQTWINDSYWLVMPFKLKDSGVTLRYLGTDSTEAGQPADLLELRFANVGVTPQNKYQVWVDAQTRLVSQWAYFPQATDTLPAFVNPWLDYQRQGRILLSGNRGTRQRDGQEFPLVMPDIFTADSVEEARFSVE